MRPRRWRIFRFLRDIQLRTTDSTSRIPCLIPFNGEGDGVAAAEAQCGDAALQVAALQFIEQRDQDARAAGADGMAERHRAAVDVHLFRIELEVPRNGNGSDGESFIELDEIDILVAVPC